MKYSAKSLKMLGVLTLVMGMTGTARAFLPFQGIVTDVIGIDGISVNDDIRGRISIFAMGEDLDPDPNIGFYDFNDPNEDIGWLGFRARINGRNFRVNEPLVYGIELLDNVFGGDQFGAFQIGELEPGERPKVDTMELFLFDSKGQALSSDQLTAEAFNNLEWESSLFKIEGGSLDRDGLFIEDSFFQITGDVRPVPEPGTLLLLGSGIAGYMGFSRRGRNKK